LWFKGWDAETCESLFEVKGFEWVLSLQADEARIAVASAASGSFFHPSILESVATL
jgi:hypothetical protein